MVPTITHREPGVTNICRVIVSVIHRSDLFVEPDVPQLPQNGGRLESVKNRNKFFLALHWTSTLSHFVTKRFLVSH